MSDHRFRRARQRRARPKLSPTLFGLFAQQMRLRPLGRLPLAFGRLTMRGDTAIARWITPVLKQREIRRDTSAADLRILG